MALPDGGAMAETREVQCPNCGSNDCLQQPNTPALFRCAYCRSLFSPPIDFRRQQPPPHQPASPPGPKTIIPSANSLTGMLNSNSSNRYLMIGFLAFFFGCAPAAPVIWYLGYREAQRNGESGSSLKLLSLLFGLPMIGFGLFVVLAIMMDAAK